MSYKSTEWGQAADRAKLGAIVGAIESGILCAVAGVLPRGWYPLAALLVGFPIFAMAYGAFLGGWAVRYVKEQDIAMRRQLVRGFEEFTSFEKSEQRTGMQSG